MDRDVVRYPYLLVENDRLPLETQLSIVAAYHLPVAAVTSSGGRSLHFLIAADADDETQFRRMAALLHERLAPLGFDDTGNPSCMTHLPGIARRDECLTSAQRHAATAQEQYSNLRGFQCSCGCLKTITELSCRGDEPPQKPSQLLNFVLHHHKQLLFCQHSTLNPSTVNTSAAKRPTNLKKNRAM